MASSDITPGILTASDADTINRSMRQLGMTRKDLDAQRQKGDELIPAQLTGKTGTAYSWKERDFDGDGNRYDAPSGLFGDSTWMPAYEPNGIILATPLEVWLRRKTETTDKGMSWEIITSIDTATLRIIDGSPDNFGYPAHVSKQDAIAGTWGDIDNTEVRVSIPGGGVLKSGDFVHNARFSRLNSGNTPCYAGPPSKGGLVLIGSNTLTSTSFGQINGGVNLGFLNLIPGATYFFVGAVYVAWQPPANTQAQLMLYTEFFGDGTASEPRIQLSSTGMLTPSSGFAPVKYLALDHHISKPFVGSFDGSMRWLFYSQQSAATGTISATISGSLWQLTN